MKAEIGMFCFGAFMFAVCAWLAWRLMDEPFYACVGVFMSAFWGGMAALGMWAAISAWSERREHRPTASWNGRNWKI